MSSRLCVLSILLSKHNYAGTLRAILVNHDLNNAGNYLCVIVRSKNKGVISQVLDFRRIILYRARKGLWYTVIRSSVPQACNITFRLMKFYLNKSRQTRFIILLLAASLKIIIYDLPKRKDYRSREAVMRVATRGRRHCRKLYSQTR